MNSSPRGKKLFAKRRKRRRQWRLGALAALVLAVGVWFAVARIWDGAPLANLFQPPSANGGDASDPGKLPSRDGEEEKVGEAPARKPAPKEPAPDPEQPTPEAAAYVAVAPELPGVGPENLLGVYRSNMDDSWASVRVAPEGEAREFVVFVHRSGDSWRAEKSMRADEPDYPDNDVVPLADVPKDLIDYLYAENVFAAEVPEPRQTEINRDDLPRVEPAEFSSTQPVMDSVPDQDRERVV